MWKGQKMSGSAEDDNEHQRREHADQLRSIAAQNEPLLAQARGHGGRESRAGTGCGADIAASGVACAGARTRELRLRRAGSRPRSGVRQETVCAAGWQKPPRTARRSPAILQTGRARPEDASRAVSPAPQNPAAASTDTVQSYAEYCRSQLSWRRGSRIGARCRFMN